jgi:hypothetical protein
MIFVLTRRIRFIGSLLLVGAAFTIAGTAFAAGSFSDVPSSHSAYAAVEYLKANGMLQGYADGTFRPDKKINRAEALKIIVSNALKPEEIAQYTGTSYADVPADAWFVSYVGAALTRLRIIDGPPKTANFNPTRNITRAEFFKLYFGAMGVDASSAYSDVQTPLSTDVPDAKQWFYPYMRYAVSTSVIMIDTKGLLLPSKEITRGEMALLIYRYQMFKAARRTQALLSEAEAELVNVLSMIDAKNGTAATAAATRARLAALGALQSRPNEPLVKGAVKMSEAFLEISAAYNAGVEGKLADVISHSGSAWNLAQEAQNFEGSLNSLASQVQAIAKKMADEARAIQQ